MLAQHILDVGKDGSYDVINACHDLANPSPPKISLACLITSMLGTSPSDASDVP